MIIRAKTLVKDKPLKEQEDARVKSPALGTDPINNTEGRRKSLTVASTDDEDEEDQTTMSDCEGGAHF